LYGPEICDNLDNNCLNGVDEGLATQYSYPEDQFPGTVGVGQCQPEITRCENGKWQVVQQAITPTSPHPCENGGDFDCDGFPDLPGNSKPNAVVIALDLSQSMVYDMYQNAIVYGLCGLANNSAYANDKMAIVGISKGIAPLYSTLLSDFTDLHTACAILQNPYINNETSGVEYMLDGAKLGWQLNWPAGYENLMFGFTDEILQVGGATSIDATAACTATPFKFGIFTLPEFDGDWHWAETDCGGFIDSLSANYNEMAAKIAWHLPGGSCPN
jgi:hypothetical protein